MTTRTLCRRIIASARQKGLWLATAESLTGGMIVAALVDISGASACVKGGLCSYDPSIKHDVLGVTQNVIDELGVVSAECAQQMAQGAQKLMKADIAVSATGVAGPGGGTDKTPVGTVFLGIADGETLRTVACHFSGSRTKVRRQAARRALELIENAIDKR